MVNSGSSPSFDESQVGLLEEKIILRQREGGGHTTDITRRFIAAINICSYILNFSLVILLIWVVYHLPVDPKQLVYSPGNEAIEYSVKVFYDDMFNMSPYQGTPTDELDRMWDDLYGGTARTLIDASAAAKLPNKTVKIKTGEHANNYIVQFEVFHQLHCLNSLRKSIYRDRFPDMKVWNDDGTMNRTNVNHYEHCLDRLRQGIMCHSDVATIHWDWKDGSELPFPMPAGKTGINMINMETTHVCRDFDRIKQWAMERNLEDWDESLII